MEKNDNIIADNIIAENADADSAATANVTANANATANATANVEAISAQSEQIASLRAELEQAHERALRMAAEAENVRKRALREVSDAKTYAITSFAKEILPVCDSLERALLTTKTTQADQATQELDNLLTGMQMTQEILLKALQHMKVNKIEALNAVFDPNFHQAMFEVPVEQPEQAGKIANIVQEGYTIGERVLRPALVGITKHTTQS